MHVFVLINAALQSECVKKAQSDRAELKRRARDVEHKLQQERQDHRDITSGTAQTQHESTISCSFNNLR